MRNTEKHDSAGWQIRLWSKGETEPVTDPKTYPTQQAAHAELVRTLRWAREFAGGETFPHAPEWVGGTVFPRST